jgi:CRP-like cAMP-binding protein
VELECIELTYLYGLFRSEPGLSKRFHKMMARTLAQRLSKLMPKRDEANKSADGQGESKRPSVRATFSGLLMSGGSSKSTSREDSAELKFARAFLKAWSADSKLTNFFTEGVVYRDPFVPHGISGRSALLKYRVSQRQSVKRWDWDDVELFPVPDGFTMRAKVHLTLSSGASATDYSLSLIVLEEGKIRRMEVYFDKATLKKADEASVTPSGAASSSASATTDDDDEDSGSGSGSSNSNPLEAPIKRRAKDIKFSKRFDLPDEEIILREFPCVYASVDVNGKLYVSNNYVCFYSRVFGLRTKEAIPFKSVKQVRKKGTDSVVLRMHRKTKSIIGGSEVKHQFIFPSQYDVDEAYATLSQRLHRLDGDDINALIVTDNDREGHVQNESYIQKFVRCSTLHVHLPEMKLKFLAVDKAVRLIAPKLNETANLIEDDSCVKTISTYPHLSTMLADGTVQVDKNIRQGDPICDQACLERFENGVLLALADGCNWGEKPRKAAYLAARTFIEYVKRSASEVLTVQDAGQLFLQAFVQAHHRIVEGYEDKWWECGTTTLIGGALVQLKDPYNPWGFVCASVGDCKAFLITRRKGVFDITSGSRTGAAATDATDSGGRIGPHVEGNPDLRNLSLYFRLVDEGDVIVVVSDGLYDNLDPQSLGISPKDAGIPDAGSDWTKIPADNVEKAKSDYMCEKIRSLLWREPVRTSRASKDDQDDFSGGEGSDDVFVDLDPTAIVESLIKHAKETTQSSRDFMEKFPNLKLPTDYTKYPGKMDHTTACAFKVKNTSFRSVEHNLDNLVIRMRHPVKGLHSVMQKLITPDAGKDPLQLAMQGQGATGAMAQVGSSRAAADAAKLTTTSTAPPPGALKRSHENQASTSSLLADFRGQLLTRWLEDNETKDPEEIAHLAQCLINFRYIRPLDLESWKTESFVADQVYQFRMYEPILTRRDWEAILLGSQIVNFKKDEAVVVEQVTQHQRLYYILSGTCRIEKAVDATSDEHKTKKRSDLISSRTGKLLLGHMYESETFGEISFLFGGRASASVIADSDEVKLYIIEGRFLDVLFVKYPSLAGRFFHYLSSVLAHRLKKQEAKKYAEAI